MRQLLAILAFLALGPIASAADPCDHVPAVARDYLKTHPGWKILRTADLILDDQALWRQYHNGLCPGMAEVDFDGNGNKYIGLALIQRGTNKYRERIVVVRTNASGPEARTIHSDFSVPPYSVIWRVGPGITWEWDKPQKKIYISNDSLVSETMESAAQQFYIKDGKLFYVQTSD